MNGSKNPFANLFRPINNPKGTPNIIPRIKPKNTLKKESHIWPIGTGILNKLNSPVTTLKTLLLKLGSTTPNSLCTGYFPGIISAIQSGEIKPTILLTSIISNQSSGIFLNPTLGFDKRINLFNVSDGFGSHLPEPCSEQLGPLDTIVPAGNKKISTSLKPPWISFLVLSKFTTAFCKSSRALGG